jgi:hypothetical protein
MRTARFNIKEAMQSSYTVHLCVAHESHNKRRSVFCEVGYILVKLARQSKTQVADASECCSGWRLFWCIIQLADLVSPAKC